LSISGRLDHSYELLVDLGWISLSSLNCDAASSIWRVRKGVTAPQPYAKVVTLGNSFSCLRYSVRTLPIKTSRFPTSAILWYSIREAFELKIRLVNTECLQAMEIEAQVKASNVEQADNKKANLENIDVYRQQYHHLLSGSTSVTTYDRKFFNSEFWQ
jgi:hypothetical protein